MSKINEWTLMFFNAGDNALSPLIISQIKAIKDAGFQRDTDVLVHFDPNEKGAPTRIFSINKDRKRLSKASVKVGDDEDPFVRNMIEDDLTAEIIKAPERLATARTGSALNHTSEAVQKMSEALKNPDKIEAEEALINFLDFCQAEHPAQHYLLFLIGHGMVVGNDTFLPDENPDTSITLKKLGEILDTFNTKIEKHKGTLELLALQSCGMSSIEVVYQLKGKANYMMASEGIAFIDSWPHRQLLKKLFKSVDKLKNQKAEARGKAQVAEVKEMEKAAISTLIKKLFFLTLHNATDYLFSGNSLDLALCTLSEKEVSDIKKPLQSLISILKEGLQDDKDPRIKELIVLAHWEAQSYWGEDYTDLFDYCLCLGRRCDIKDTRQKLIKEACDEVIKKIKAIVIHSDNFGWQYQYSHGLSIYFPWSEPIKGDPFPDRRPIEFDELGGNVNRTKDVTEYSGNGNKAIAKDIIEAYRGYTFTTDFKEGSKDTWLSFLELYFKATKRPSRAQEDGTQIEDAKLRETFKLASASVVGLSSSLPGPDKTVGTAGPACACASVKNYPTEVAISRGTCKAFDKRNGYSRAATKKKRPRNRRPRAD